MPKIVFDGRYKVHLVDTIADQDAPTVTEIEAGDDITTRCPKDFLNWGKSQGRVNAGDISTLFAAEGMGTWTLPASMQVFLDTEAANEVAWDLIDNGVLTNLVIAPYGWSGTTGDPESGDKAYVVPVEFGMPTPTNPTENENQRAEVDIAVTGEPSFNATVAT